MTKFLYPYGAVYIFVNPEAQRDVFNRLKEINDPFFSQTEKRERQIKKWSHAKKVALAEGDLDRLKALSKRVPKTREIR